MPTLRVAKRQYTYLLIIYIGFLQNYNIVVNKFINIITIHKKPKYPLGRIGVD